MNGLDIIKNKLTNISNKPGIYQYLNSKNEILYIGKAKNLKKRIKLIPTRRMATIDEVSNKIFSLASEENTLIHGQIINISGGE